MRKAYRVKRRSCKLCKPHKDGTRATLHGKARSLLEVHDAEMKAAR